MTSYLLILSESEGIRCIGTLPQVGHTMKIRKAYGAFEVITALVTRVTLTQTIENIPYDAKGSRGNEYGDIPIVYVTVQPDADV